MYLADRSRVKRFSKIFIRYIAAFLPCFIVVFCFYFLGELFCAKNDAWNSYNEMRTAKAYVYMYGWPDYDEYKDVYDKYGMSRADYAMYANAFLADETFMNMDAIKELSDITKGNLISKGIENSSSFFMKQGQSKYIMIIIAFIAIFAMVYKNKMSCFHNAFCIILVISLFYYLFLLDRLVARVTIPILFACAVFVIYSHLNTTSAFKEERTPWLIFVIAPCCVFASMYCNDEYIRAKNDYKDASAYYELISDKSQIYMVDHAIDGRKYNYQSAFEYEEENKYTNLCLYGSWTCGSPIAQEQYKALGFDNISEGLLDCRNAHLCTFNKEKVVRNFISEHYNDGKGISISIVDSNAICRVFDFYRYDIDFSDEGTGVGITDWNIDTSGTLFGGYNVLTIKYEPGTIPENVDIYLMFSRQDGHLITYASYDRPENDTIRFVYESWKWNPYDDFNEQIDHMKLFYIPR